jgi:hypothetical protein
VDPTSSCGSGPTVNPPLFDKSLSCNGLCLLALGPDLAHGLRSRDMQADALRIRQLRAGEG